MSSLQSQKSSFACCRDGEHSGDTSVVDDDSVIEVDTRETDTAVSINNNTNLKYNSVATMHDRKSSGVFAFPRRIPVDVEFQDIRYTVGKFSFSKRAYEKKEILHKISGAFRAGQLTAIMGPSGAGKSTLLNIMAGYVETGVTGTILVNGKNRSNNSQTFRNMSAYIHQDAEQRNYLTVGEAMTVAAHLKLGYSVSQEYKQSVIHKVLILLGLEAKYNTFAGRLSGGQSKRLAIALEMINNPPVIFLDEPTTGLDSSSTTSCISLLKRLAQEGRTIVCTIHQPSALLFEMFDKLYAVVGGDCIYQGPVKQLVPFMSDLGLPCPSYHNPADFLMEVAVGDYDFDLNRMINAASKKYYEDRDQHCLMIEQQVEKLNGMDLPPTIGLLMRDQKIFKYASTVPVSDDFFNPTQNTTVGNGQLLGHPASLWMQFYLLFVRNVRSNLRNRFFIIARIVAHVIISILFGYIYVNVGQTATTVLANYVYLYGTILLIVYTGKMSVLLSFPLEMEILTREHFNRWYQLGPYYLSIILFEIPFQMLCASLYVAISYYLTGNFSDLFRFNYFMLMCMLVTICAQSWGFFIGVTVSVKIAVFVGPILAVLFSVFGFCTRYVDITPMFSWMWHISYFRAAFHGSLNSVYGMNRTDLQCPDTTPLLYCHFKNPRIFLTEMLIDDQPDLTDNVVLMGGVIVAMHVLTAMALWLRLNKR